jgi:ribokinase
MALRAVCLGHVTCDIIIPLHGWPDRDTKTIVPETRLCGGGPAANTAAALARLGVDVGLVGRLGDDAIGRQTYAMHEQDGIDTSHLQISAGVTSPLSVILADLSDATRTILLTKGVNTALPAAALDFEWLRLARVIHLDGHQMEASLAVARAAREWPAVRVTLDAGSMKAGLLELVSLADITFASKRFCCELVGELNPEACIEKLHQAGAKWAGVTLGADGSLLSTSGELLRQEAFRVPAQDTTGAGDAFHGGFIYGLLNGASAQECLRIASAVAAIKCTGIGAREALPDEPVLAGFLARAPVALS